MTTKIEWTHRPGYAGATWNPIRARDPQTGQQGWHCEHVHDGCRNCYAERLNRKSGASGGTGHPYTRPARDRVEVYLDDRTLLAPLKRRKPTCYFTCSMTDAYGPWVPKRVRDRIKAVQASCPHHTFIELTKRQHDMRTYHKAEGLIARIWDAANDLAVEVRQSQGFNRAYDRLLVAGFAELPLPNLWAGVSVSSQPDAEAMIPALLATDLAVRVVSYEPALGPLDLTRIKIGSGFVNALTGVVTNDDGSERGTVGSIDWVIFGGETGPDARVYHPGWEERVRLDCAHNGVAYFRKQWGEYRPGSDAPDGSLGATRLEFSRWPIAVVSRDGRVATRRDGQYPRLQDFPHGANNRDGWVAMRRVGRKAAGHLLDGVEHQAWPEVQP